MFTVVVSCAVELPLDTVFGYLADFRNAPAWQPQLESVRLPDGPFPDGKQVIEVHRMLGTRIDAVGTLIDWQPGETFTVRGGSGPLTVESKYGFTTDGSTTRVTLHLTMVARGPARAIEPVLRMRLTRDLRASFERLESTLTAAYGQP